jgi:hypothetical protein
VVVHNAAQAAAALAAAGPDGVVLLSAPGAAASLGPAWFRALAAAAAASRPGVPHWAVLDCGNAPGLALAALRGGFRTLVLDAACPAFARVSALATAAGGVVLAARPAALDLSRIDLRRPGGLDMLAQWLRCTPDDTRDITR